MGFMSTEQERNLLQEYQNSGLTTFYRESPLIKLLLFDKVVERLSYKGPWLERGFTYRATGSGQAIFRGDEPLVMNRRPVSKKYQIETAMFQLVTSPVNQRELDTWDNTHEYQVAVRWIDDHVMNLEKEFLRALEEFFFTGVVTSDIFTTADFEGFQCLNGEKVSATSVRGVAGGILESLAPASQINTLHTLAKNVSLGWYNQYSDSTGFIGGNSQSALRDVVLKCRRRSMDNSVPTLAFCDTDSVVKFMEQNDKRLVINNVADLNKTPTGNNPMLDSFVMDDVLKLRGYHSENLTRAAFVGTGANGVIMLINPKGLAVIDGGASSDLNGKRKGNYRDRHGKAVNGWETPFELAAGQEVYVSKKRIEGQLVATNPASCGILTGTAR